MLLQVPNSAKAVDPGFLSCGVLANNDGNHHHIDSQTVTIYERRSLTAAKWANLVMAVSGIVAAWLSRSDALMVDGLYSGLGFISSIIAIKVSESVARDPDRRRPFGYEANQSIFVAFRSLSILGVVAFAGFAAIKKLVTYFGGGEVVALVLGPILVYSIAMAVIAFSVAAYHRANLKRSGGTNQILRTEYLNSIMDGGLSIGAGAALLGAPLLSNTLLGFLVPVADSIVVLVLLAIFIRKPAGVLVTAVREVAGEAEDDHTLNRVRKITEQALAGLPFSVIEVTASKLGPRWMVVAYVRPDEPVTGEELDQARDRLSVACDRELGPSRAEILAGARPAFE